MTNINYIMGDATLPVGNGCKYLVHIVNDIGAWGKGFVVALAKRYPMARTAYRKSYRRFRLGDIQFVMVSRELVIVNLFGQKGIWRRDNRAPIRYGAIRRGLAKLAKEVLDEMNEGGEVSVHMPKIGCGLAGGRWAEIKPLIRDELLMNDIIVYVYGLAE